MNPVFNLAQRFRVSRLSRRPSRLTALLCALCLFVSGCTTTRTLEPRPDMNHSEYLKPGDIARFYFKDGRSLRLSVVSVGDAQLLGDDPSGEPVTIDLADIQSMRVTSKITKDSTWLTLSLVALAIGIYAIANRPDDLFSCSPECGRLP